jgi:hypothetical protein
MSQGLWISADFLLREMIPKDQELTNIFKADKSNSMAFITREAVSTEALTQSSHPQPQNECTPSKWGCSTIG